MKNNSIEADLPKILIVDDKLENLIALEKILTPLKLNVIKATSGNEALRLLLSYDFSMILLDVMMPAMNGFEVATLMHANETTKHIPIIFVTAINKSETYMLHGMEVGAVDYLYKPIDPIVLLSKVRVFVNLYKIRNQLEMTIAQLSDSQDQLEEKNKELKQVSEEDALTKIPNRRFFETQFSAILEKAKQQKTIVALFFIDLDNFKFINDQYGHEVGDALLKAMAERISNITRAGDIVMPSREFTTVARLGGDEFVIVAENIDTCANAIFIARRLLKSMVEPFIYQDITMIVSSSIGIACYPTAGKTVDEMMRAADGAMYRAKQSGKNRYEFFTPVINEYNQRRFLIEEGLKKAIEQHELQVAYQPIVDLKNNHVVGFEALLRWNNKKLGVVSPQEFIAIAEESGSIIAIGFWVLDQICADYQTILEKTTFTPNIIAVNIAPIQLQDPDFKNKFLTITQQHHLPLSHFLLELTESALIQNPNEVYEHIDQLNQQGLRFALDDFGTGQSSLKWLKNVPISVLKIDQSFVQGAPYKKMDSSIVKSILSLAKSLNLEVIAEGVETAAQLQFLQKHHCMMAQGYYFAHHLLLDEFIKFVNNKK